MNSQLMIKPEAQLPIPKDNRQIAHRMKQYHQWLAENSIPLFPPDLESYKGHLFAKGLKASSVATHISTIKGAYRKLAKNRDYFYQNLDPEIVEKGILHQKAVVDEAISRLNDSLDLVTVEAPTQQDQDEAGHIRLTPAQIDQLLAGPNINSFSGLRDLAIISLMLATGIRQQEAADLDVEDLRVRANDGGSLCLKVRKGKGNKGRLIPYGQLDWILVIVDKWLEAAGIQEGAVFPSYFKGYQKVRGRLSGVAIQNILKAYPVVIDGKLTPIKPHDLRRTYAKLLHDSGKRLLHVSQNLGHARLETTKGYIGSGDMAQRSPEELFNFDLGKLASLPL